MWASVFSDGFSCGGTDKWSCLHRIFSWKGFCWVSERLKVFQEVTRELTGRSVLLLRYWTLVLVTAPCFCRRCRRSWLLWRKCRSQFSHWKQKPERFHMKCFFNLNIQYWHVKILVADQYILIVSHLVWKLVSTT